MRSYNGNLTIYQHAEGVGQVRWSSSNSPSIGITLLYNSNGSVILLFEKKNYSLLYKYSSFLDSPYVVILSKSGPSLHFSPSPAQWSQFDQEGSIFNRTTSARPRGEIEVGMRNVTWEKIEDNKNIVLYTNAYNGNYMIFRICFNSELDSINTHFQRIRRRLEESWRRILHWRTK